MTFEKRILASHQSQFIVNKKVSIIRGHPYNTRGMRCGVTLDWSVIHGGMVSGQVIYGVGFFRQMIYGVGVSG